MRRAILFSRISYHVYTVPICGKSKNRALYTNFWRRPGLSRMRVSGSEPTKNSFLRGHWFELGMLALSFSYAPSASASDSSLSRFLTANILGVGYLLIVLFIEHDIGSGGDKP